MIFVSVSDRIQDQNHSHSLDSPFLNSVGNFILGWNLPSVVSLYEGNRRASKIAWYGQLLTLIRLSMSECHQQLAQGDTHSYAKIVADVKSWSVRSNVEFP